MADEKIEAAVPTGGLAAALQKSTADLLTFKGMSTSDRQAVEKYFTKKACESGEVICKEGDPGDSMFIILKGSVEILRSKRREEKTEVAAVVEAGQVVGEAAIIDARPRNATVRAKEKCEILLIPKMALDAFKKEHPSAVLSLYESILGQISARFRAVSDKKDLFSFWLS